MGKFINSVIGTEALRQQKGWGLIGNNQVNTIANDYWTLYEHIVPKDKHIQLKAENFTVEGFKSLFWQSKCYSKSIEMLTLSVLLLIHHRNSILAIFN